MSVIERFSIMPSWKDDGRVGEYRPEDESGRSKAYTGHRSPAANALYFTDDLCVQRQTAAVRMFLSCL
jgi:hypothetical protein